MAGRTGPVGVGATLEVLFETSEALTDVVAGVAVPKMVEELALLPLELEYGDDTKVVLEIEVIDVAVLML